MCFYQVAASFITMDETREAIEEALSMVKTWNKLWTPKSWIVDYAQSENSALENLFPGMNMDLYSSLSDMVPKIMLINGKMSNLAVQIFEKT